MASNILTAFNDHFMDFVSDIQSVFPNDVDILTAKNSLLAIRKANPKMIVKIWKKFISDKYSDEILAGNIDFFIKLTS
jgi:accessory colonization factor AcfC